MSSLSIFPIEILECITSMVPTLQQMRLWQSGDRILNIKLKNGGLKRTSLSWSGSSWMPWPKSYFTTFDGLVDVEWAMDIGSSLCPMLELNLLPKTLKRLHLDCDDVFLLLSKQNVRINEVLPTLHTLHLSGMRIREENLKNLPSNLIELCVTSEDQWIRSCSLFRDLPKTIQILSLSVYLEDKSEHENDLPSELISLKLSYLKSNFNWLTKLPKSLTSFKIRSMGFKPIWLTLPPKLEKLKFFSVGHLAVIPKSDLAQLPQSLKSLELYQIPDDVDADNELFPLLPKSLTRFALSAILEFSGRQQVPVSLTDFDVGVSATHPDIASFFHSESIRMDLKLGDLSQQLNFLPIPPKLQYLELDYINDDICTMLPSCLKEIKILGGLITTKGASKFPQSITSVLANLEVFDTNEAMACIRHVSNIELWIDEETKGRKVNEDWISSLLHSSTALTSLKDGCVPGCTSFHDFNDRLRSLIVQGSAGWYSAELNRFIKESFFDTLPKFKYLNTLKLLQCGGIECDWLCSIPKTVTNLEIFSLATYPNATQLSMLPRGLIYLSYGVSNLDQVCEWQDETLQFLPRSLQKLNIPRNIPNITHRMYEYLPPNLQESSLKNETKLSFATPLERMYGKSSSHT